MKTSPFLEVSEEYAAVADTVMRSLARVQDRLDAQLATDLPPVAELCRHIEQFRGKMLRPSLSVLSGMACGAERPDDGHVVVAAVVELIHLATLVHDDVLDEADMRRGGATINNLRGNEAAVILGDYLISSAFHLCSSLDDQTIALRIGEVTTEVCAGELLQLHHRDDFSLDEETYFEIIDRKTASLIGVACETGGAVSGASAKQRRALYEIGAGLGAAFQIRDDLLDITGEEERVGKPLGRDAEKGKLTLPMIHHLRESDTSGRESALFLLGKIAAERAGARSELAEALMRTGSIEYALERAESLVLRARTRLSEFEPNPAVGLLDELARAVLSRDR